MNAAGPSASVATRMAPGDRPVVPARNWAGSTRRPAVLGSRLARMGAAEFTLHGIQTYQRRLIPFTPLSAI